MKGNNVKEVKSEKKERLNPKLAGLSVISLALAFVLLVMTAMTGYAFFHMYEPPKEEVFLRIQNIFWAAVFFGVSFVASLVLSEKLADEAKRQCDTEHPKYLTPDVCIWLGLLLATADPAFGFLLEQTNRIFSVAARQPMDYGFGISVLFCFPWLGGVGLFLSGLLDKY